MAAKPPQVCNLTQGKAIGAKVHEGFAATWNWLLSFVSNLSGGNGVEVKDDASGHPTVEVLIEGGDGIDVSCGGAGQPYVIGLVDSPSGGGDVTITGTDDSETDEASAFTFESASDSNVEVTCSGTTITVGVYWT